MLVSPKSPAGLAEVRQTGHGHAGYAATLPLTPGAMQPGRPGDVDSMALAVASHPFFASLAELWSLVFVGLRPKVTPGTEPELGS